MAVSSYQVQRLVTRIRRERAAAEPDGPETEGASVLIGADRVRLSALAREQAAEVAASVRLPAGAPLSPATIVDETPLPLATRIELERRAGSFMRPPQPPEPPTAAIPRVRRPPSPEPEPLEEDWDEPLPSDKE